MRIKDKQYQFLIRLLYQGNYRLSKSIDDLTVNEASIIIDGLLNKGVVSNIVNFRVLSDFEHRKKQELFNSLVTLVEPMATVRQMTYIENLITLSDYKLKTKKIPISVARKIISFLKDGVEFECIDSYLAYIDATDLIINLQPSVPKGYSFPDNWYFFDVDLSGILKQDS